MSEKKALKIATSGALTVLLTAGSITPALANTPTTPTGSPAVTTPIAAPTDAKKYEGYTVSVGVFDKDNQPMAAPQVLPFDKLQVQVPNLPDGENYTVKILSIMDDKGNDVTAQFTHKVTFTEEVVPGKSRNVYVKSSKGVQVGQQKIALGYESQGKTYVLGVNGSNKLVGTLATVDQNQEIATVDANNLWDIKQDTTGRDINIGISGKDLFMHMGYSGVSMLPLDIWRNPGFTYENGKLRGNSTYRQFINANAENITADYNNGVQISVWEATTLKDPDTKTLHIQAQVTPIPNKPVTPVGPNKPNTSQDNKDNKTTQNTTKSPKKAAQPKTGAKKQALPKTGDSNSTALPLAAGAAAVVAGAVLAGKSRIKDLF